MTAIIDLSPCEYFPVPSENLVAVGWLSKESNFELQSVDWAFFEKLTSLFKEPWQPVASAGWYTCSLCQFNSPRFHSNVFIPYDGRIFVAPEGILHYIAAHWYKPPDIFVRAVMNCPAMNSMEYKKALLANGGRNLVQAVASQNFRGPMHLSPESIDKIRALGLDVNSEPSFVADHIAFPNGYLVIKPEKTLGNFVPGREGWFTSYLGVDEKTDAPVVYIFFKEGQWWYEVCEYTPGPGPGDFRRSTKSEREVLEKLRVYFFESNPDFDALKSAE